MRSSTDERTPQRAYSEIQEKTRDERRRRMKAAKILSVLRHFVGGDLAGKTVLDVGCSTGYTADVLRQAGADVVGIDIDVPGLAHANQLFGTHIHFLCADGSALPFKDQTFDIIVFNHIYEHVVDADAVMIELRRVLADKGLMYLGFGNRLGVIEPHYRLPFLSWLPHRLADRYVAASGRAPNYYERFRTRSGLLRMCDGLRLWDYTYTVLSNPEVFSASDMVPRRLTSAPPALWKALSPIMPTFIWVGTKAADHHPKGEPVREPPRLIHD